MRKFYRILRNKGRSKQKLQFENDEGQTMKNLTKISSMELKFKNTGDW